MDSPPLKGVAIITDTGNTGQAGTYEGHLQYNGFSWDYAQAAKPGSPQVSGQSSEGTTLAVTGPPGYRFDSVENRIRVLRRGRGAA